MFVNSSIDQVHIRMLLSHFQYKLDEQMEVDILYVMEYLNVKKIQILLRQIILSSFCSILT